MRQNRFLIEFCKEFYVKRAVAPLNLSPQLSAFDSRYPVKSVSRYVAKQPVSGGKHGN